MIDKQVLRHTKFFGIIMSALFKQCDWKKTDICIDFHWSNHTVDALLKGEDKKLSYYLQLFDLLLQYSDRNFYFITLMKTLLYAILTNKTVVIGIREKNEQRIKKWAVIMEKET